MAVKIRQSGAWVDVASSNFNSGQFTADPPFYRNTKSVSANYIVTSTYNEMTIGPITINNGVTVTVNTGGVWKII